VGRLGRDFANLKNKGCGESRGPGMLSQNKGKRKRSTEGEKKYM